MKLSSMGKVKLRSILSSKMLGNGSILSSKILGKVELSSMGKVKLRSILSSKMLGLSSILSWKKWNSVPFYPGKSETEVHFIQQSDGNSGTQVHFILGKVELSSMGKVKLRSILSSKMLGLSSILSWKKWNSVPWEK